MVKSLYKTTWRDSIIPPEGGIRKGDDIVQYNATKKHLLISLVKYLQVFGVNRASRRSFLCAKLLFQHFAKTISIKR